MSLELNRADLEKDPKRVSGMFDQVASAYDRTNTILSLGNDKLWRIATLRAINPQPDEVILDLAAGTGASSVALAKRAERVVAGDFSSGMIEEGQRRHAEIGNLEFELADAMNLPFDDDSFDVVTISFGLRNVQDPAVALKEMLRVTKPGGRLVICEFSHPQQQHFSKVYSWYNDNILPHVAKLFSSNKEAYDYLNESIASWPDQRGLAKLVREAGWGEVAYRDLTFGIVALHRAVKPAK